MISYHLPPIVIHILAPQNDFGMPKITWSNHKSFGIEEKLPKNPVFFSERLPNVDNDDGGGGGEDTDDNWQLSDDPTIRLFLKQISNTEFIIIIKFLNLISDIK